MNRCQRSGGGLTVLVFDLDFFQSLNDREGHSAGNNLLQALALVLRQRCRSYDVVARVGGDEFVVLLPGPDAELPQAQPQWLQAVLADACDQAGIDCEVTASMGIARFPVDGETAESLLTAANRRMYLQKEQHHLATETRLLEMA